MGLNDFGAYVKTNIRERLKFSKTTPITKATDALYDKYVKETIMSYEESNLESKYPDFKALMREYREGILLFEITKNEVWDKASQDTVGLKKYYTKNKGKYLWPVRYQLQKVTITAKDSKSVESAYKYIKKKGMTKFKSKYGDNSDYTIHYNKETIDKDSEDAKAYKTGKVGEVTDISIVKNSGYFHVLTEVLSADMKTLSEARGYVIADYQDFLEKQWVDQLKAEHPIKVNEKTLKSIIR